MKKIFFLILAFSALACAADSSAAPSIYERVISWYNEHLNYGTVALLMTIESSFIPFPSELVIPPAAYKVFSGGTDMHIVLILLAGTCGALLGAFINYFLAKYLGRPIVYKFADSRLGRLCLLDSSKVAQAEEFFRKHGAISTLVGRLIPAIRQLISIPAGLSRMKLLPFAIFTAIGATVWNIVLIVLGYVAHGNQELIEKYSSELSLGLVVLGVLFVFYLVWQAIRPKKKTATSENSIPQSENTESK